MLACHRRLQLLPIVVLLGGAVVTLAPAAPATAQQKYRLKEGAAKGDASENTGLFSMKMKLTVSAAGASQDTDLNMRQDEKYQEEVLSVDGKGIPTAVRRTYAVKKETGAQPGEGEKTTVSSLQGKTVTIRRNGNKVEVTVAKGTIAASDRKELEDSLKDATGVFPDREVGPGDDWDVDPKAAKFLGDASITKATCHFQDVVERDGHKCAHVRMALEFTANTGDPMAPPLKLNVTGDLYEALDIQRPLALELAGKASMKGDVTANGMTLSMNGEGPVELKMSAKWLKIAGKSP